MNTRNAALPDFDVPRIVVETFVRCVELRERVASTNDLAVEMSTSENVETPLLVLAREQTAGRGRGANQWWSAPGALTFSLLLDAHAHSLPRSAWPRVSLTAGLAVCEALDSLLPHDRPALKWPNDVYLRGRKVCGVLVEATSPAPRQSTHDSTVPTAPSQREARQENRLVVGVGLNVNNSLAAAPEPLASQAIALVDAVGHPWNLTDVLTRVLGHMDDCWRMLDDEDARLAERWQTFCALSGRTVQLQAGPRLHEGLCHGIDAEGALLLETNRGVQRFFAGVIRSFE